ncbi:hypothetical protein [Leptospira santarosai]|uniref:hypothetical protein n=1 Tax=Leptospira santarosai TaxID=28183 RepID=UPI0002BF4FE7|nr:hypothetical protein [Leptospira santarosai]EMP02352.1 hypothetical protein LEP1GSC171_0253 [Leptospira santarosai str. HAI1380]
MGIYQNGAVEINPSTDETKVPRVQVRLMEESGDYSFTISESKFYLLERAILEKNSFELIPKELIPKELIPKELIPKELIPKELIPKELIPIANEQEESGTDLGSLEVD